MSSLLRSSSALARPLNTRLPISALPAARAAFSQSATVRGGAKLQLDPPTGNLFGKKKGEKKEREGWEYVWWFGYCGSMVVAAIAYAFKPDTSIQTWALEEARRRLEAEGLLPDPDKVNDKQ